MRKRSRSEAQILRSSVALMWLGGKTETQIAKACGITVTYVAVIVHSLRSQGWDLPRRKHRRGGTVEMAVAA